MQEHCHTKLLATRCSLLAAVLPFAVTIRSIRCRFTIRRSHSLLATPTRYSLPFRLGRNFAFPFLVATPLSKTCQNFCQRKEVKAMNRELSDIIAMVEAGQLDLILQAVQEIEEAWLRSWVLRDIAEAMAKVGQFDRALQIAQKIESAKIESALVRFLALAGIAAAMAEAGQTERANQVFQLARQVVQKIEVASACFEGLGGIAKMVEAGQFDLALQVAQKIEDASARSEALKDIAEAMAEAGQFDRALSSSPRKLKTH